MYGIVICDGALNANEVHPVVPCITIISSIIIRRPHYTIFCAAFSNLGFSVICVCLSVGRVWSGDQSPVLVSSVWDRVCALGLRVSHSR